MKDNTALLMQNNNHVDFMHMRMMENVYLVMKVVCNVKVQSFTNAQVVTLKCLMN